jgi:putative glutamine amidotransferase
MRPVVLVTTDRRNPGGLYSSTRIRPRRPEAFLAEAYIEAVRQAGGVPLLLPPGDADALPQLLQRIDAVVLTGGDFDIHPSWYGEDVVARLDRVEASRTQVEVALARLCLARDIPILGICGGMQALAVAAGGRLIQDLPPEGGEHLAHEQPTDPAVGWHKVRTEAPAAEWLGAEVFANSTHHQAVRDAGRGLRACGWATDGVVEVIAAEKGFALGVQWHPELLGDLRPYEALVTARSRASLS